MKKVNFLVILMIILSGCSNVPIAKRLPPILACDQSQQRIVLLESNSDWSDKSSIIWQWSANTDKGIDAKHRKWFRNPTDAKPVATKNQIITVASGGAVALVDFKTSTMTLEPFFEKASTLAK